jgi:hypothetical protein
MGERTPIDEELEEALRAAQTDSIQFEFNALFVRCNDAIIGRVSLD